MMSLLDSKLGRRASKEAKLSFCKGKPFLYQQTYKEPFTHGAYMLSPDEQIPMLPATLRLIEDKQRNGR